MLTEFIFRDSVWFGTRELRDRTATMLMTFLCPPPAGFLAINSCETMFPRHHECYCE